MRQRKEGQEREETCSKDCEEILVCDEVLVHAQRVFIVSIERPTPGVGMDSCPCSIGTVEELRDRGIGQSILRMFRVFHVKECDFCSRGMTIVELIGGVTSIQGATHCATHMSSMSSFGITPISVVDVLDDLPLGHVVGGVVRRGSRHFRTIRIAKKTTQLIHTSVA
jgi:hypothetical protein